MTYQTVNLIKATTALAGTVLLLAGWVLARRNKESVLRRTRDTMLATLGALAFAGWFNYGYFHFNAFLHYHEFFHYYLGAKYFDELGYTRLYHCVAVADVRDGFGPEARSRWIRNLETNVLEPGWHFADRQDECTSHFSEARWEDFRTDVRWFRSNVTKAKWLDIAMDHGYNATPLWTTVGRMLANATGPVSKDRLFALAVIDLGWLVLMWVSVWWAFGWRTMCVALVWWGTNFAARYTWTGGAFMRADWLALLVVGICVARRGAPRVATALVTVSAFLRIFPGLAFAGPVSGVVTECWSARSVRPARRGIPHAAVVLAVVSLIVPLTWYSASDGATWARFRANTRKHLATPLSNNVGLPTAIAFDETSRAVHIKDLWLDTPWDIWRARRADLFAQRRVWYWSLVSAFVVALALATRGRPEWEALILGIGLVPMAVDLTSYYYSMLLVYALLWPRWPLVGVGLLTVAAFSNAVAAVFSEFDDIFGLLSAAIVVFVWIVTLGAVRAARTTPTSLPQQMPATL